jgi:HPt (histidine-containing phosphotransfer) domain-containing protein
MDDAFRGYPDGGDSWSASPVIDLVHLACQTQGDRGLESELLELFQRQCERIIARLQIPVASRGVGEDEDLAHTLRGSALAVGAGRVALAAEAYELSARRGAPDAALLADLAAAASEARAAISILSPD